MPSWPNVVLAKECSGPYQSIGDARVRRIVFEHPKRIHGTRMADDVVQANFTSGGSIDLVNKFSVRATAVNEIVGRERNRAANLGARRLGLCERAASRVRRDLSRGEQHTRKRESADGLE